MYYKIALEVIVCLFLGVCSITDFLWRKIWLPVLAVGGGAVLFCIAGMDGDLAGHAVCGILYGAGFVGMSILTGGQIEKGDGLVLGVMGLALGLWNSIAFLFLSLCYAFLAALFLVIVRKKNKSYRMPFVPFALAGYLTLLFMGGLL